MVFPFCVFVEGAYGSVDSGQKGAVRLVLGGLLRKQGKEGGPDYERDTNLDESRGEKESERGGGGEK